MPRPTRPLLDVLRETHGLTGTKLVCGAGVCGACTVLIDGKPAVSCLMPAAAVAGRSVTTVEGIGAERLHPVQQAFMANDALQCGFCTPGFIVEAVAFHDGWRASRGSVAPSREEIAAALAGHLCRCGAYAGIYRAVADACAGKFDTGEAVAPRVEARAKVTGAAKYTVDIKHPGQLEGAILRSPWAHARVLRIDCAPALGHAGVAAAVPLVEAGDVVRYFGEPVAAVAAGDLADGEGGTRPHQDRLRAASRRRRLRRVACARRRAGLLRILEERPRRRRGDGVSRAVEGQPPRPVRRLLAEPAPGPAR